jgi:hypothetical protein
MRDQQPDEEDIPSRRYEWGWLLFILLELVALAIGGIAYWAYYNSRAALTGFVVCVGIVVGAVIVWIVMGLLLGHTNSTDARSTAKYPWAWVLLILIQALAILTGGILDWMS